MEIAPGVHQVRRLVGSDMFLVAEARLTLIDPGMVGARRSLQRYLRRIGRSLDELDMIVCTHGHPDHIDGVHELVRDRDDIEVLMHADDLAGLRRPLREALAVDEGAARRGNLIQYLTRLPASVHDVADGQALPMLGGLRVVHTPGHTPGSICLYAPRHRLLFTGDALQVIRGQLTYASAIFSHDIVQARASVERLAALEVDTIALSHYPPWRREPRAALERLVERAAAS